MNNALQSLRHFRSASELDLITFADLCAQENLPEDYPRADRLLSGVPIYGGEAALALTRRDASRRHLLDEWHHCLLDQAKST